tara:strand:+ start:116 stop:304 length:189 start_codon:yes stop_codon:yes gene_type:complete
MPADETALLDNADFRLFPYIDRYSWMQREYARMIEKHASLVLAQRRASQPSAHRRRRSSRHE